MRKLAGLFLLGLFFFGFYNASFAQDDYTSKSTEQPPIYFRDPSYEHWLKSVNSSLHDKLFGKSYHELEVVDIPNPQDEREGLELNINTDPCELISSLPGCGPS